MAPMTAASWALAALACGVTVSAHTLRAEDEGFAQSARSAGVKGRIPSAQSTPVLRGKKPQKSLAVHHANVSRQFTWYKGRAGARNEILEEWKDGGFAVTPAFSAADLSAAMAPITGETYGKTLHEFVDFQSSRFVTNPGNAKASQHLIEKFAALGFTVKDEKMDDFLEENVHLPGDAHPGKNAPGNIIAYMKGTDLAHETVLMGAHYDSVNWEDTKKAAPGCDDNGSGVAALLMTAEAVAAQAKTRRPRRSVVLVAFQAEEEGLVGSKWFVQDALAKGEYGKLVAAVIADEVTFAGRSDHARKAIFETVGNTPENGMIMDTLAHSAMDDNDFNGFEVNYHGFGSDHIPFLDAGFPAVLLIEHDNSYVADSWGHSARDDFSHVDFSFGAAMTRLATQTILTLASPSSKVGGNATLAQWGTNATKKAH